MSRICTSDVDRTKAQPVGFTQRDVAQQSAGLAQRQLPDFAHILAEPQERRQLLDRNPDAAVPVGVAAGPGEHSDHRRGRAGERHRRSWALWLRCNAVQAWRWFRTTTFQPVIDIFGSVAGPGSWVASQATSTRSLMTARKSCRAARRWLFADRSRRCSPPTSACLTGLAFAIAAGVPADRVNFQSWLDPFIIITALPAALAGIVWFLFVTSTTISVPALTGSIMCMGVATANSILVVSFAKEQLGEGKSDAEAAPGAGFTRFRPVLMTALAMIIGMVPMAMGLGEGGEQNAPLGRAVIGGLIFATVATLFFVPAFFSVFTVCVVKPKA